MWEIPWKWLWPLWEGRENREGRICSLNTWATLFSPSSGEIFNPVKIPFYWYYKRNNAIPAVSPLRVLEITYESPSKIVSRPITLSQLIGTWLRLMSLRCICICITHAYHSRSFAYACLIAYCRHSTFRYLVMRYINISIFHLEVCYKLWSTLLWLKDVLLKINS